MPRLYVNLPNTKRMHLVAHLTAAAGFYAIGQPIAAIATLLPDVPIWFNTVRGFILREPVWKTSLRVTDSPAYQITHSLPFVICVGCSFASWWAVIGVLVHLLMDIPHYGGLKVPLLFPWKEVTINKVIVPLSGGHDSVRCLAVARGCYPKHLIHPVFVDYGQPFVKFEWNAAVYACHMLGLDPPRRITIPKIEADADGKFADRNCQIIEACLAGIHEEEPIDMLIGSRTPLALFDKYGDCAPSNISKFLTAEGWVNVSCHYPCMLLPDFFIRHTLRQCAINPSYLYSTKP